MSTFEHFVITLANPDQSLPTTSDQASQYVLELTEFPNTPDRLHVARGLEYNIPVLAQRLQAKIASLPAQSQPYNAWLVANLDEAVSRGTFLDVAALVRALDHQKKLELHAIVCLPESQSMYDTQPAAESGALMRELSRALLVFGQEPPPPSRFNNLQYQISNLNQQATDTRLFASCTLVSSDRQLQTLRGIAREQGLYPMIADVIRVLSERPAVASLSAMQHDTATRLTTKQQLDNIALFSSIGTYTWHFPASVLIAEVGDTLLAEVLERLLAPVTQTNNLTSEAWQRMASHHDIDLYHAVQAPRDHWERSDIFALLERRESRGVLNDYANHGLPFWVRAEHLSKGGKRTTEALRQQIKQYGAQYLGNEHAPGNWRTYLTSSRQTAIGDFEQVLYSDVVTLLNYSNPDGGQLARAEQFVHAVHNQLQTFVPRLDQHSHYIQNSLADVRQQADDALAHADGRGLGDLWRWLKGEVTTNRQEDALKAWQDVYATELEGLAAQEAVHAVTLMADIAQQLAQTLAAYREQLTAQLSATQTRLDVARECRRSQINFFRVRHEWGMPYQEAGNLREYLDVEGWEQLPRGNEDRNLVQQWRDYIDGKHLTRLTAQRQINLATLQERIRWTWQHKGQNYEVVGSVVGTDGQSSNPLFDETALSHVAHALFTWFWNINLSDLWIADWDTGASDSTTRVARYVNQVSSAAINYRPTATDAHEEHSFLIHAPSAHTTTRDFFAALETSLAQNANQRRTFKRLDGSDPQRMTLVQRWELIGALDSGALPILDYLATMYDEYPNATNLHGSANERIIAPFEVARKEGQFSSVQGRGAFAPQLVDALYNAEYFDYFVQAIAHNDLTISFSRDRSGNSEKIMLNLQQRPIELADLSQIQPWITALRRFMLEIAPAHTDQLSSYPKRSSVDYAKLIDADDGILARLRQSTNPIERDLADLITIRFEQWSNK